MRHLKAMLLGLGTLILGSIVVTGPENTFLLLLIVVICTAGLGLIPLLLVSWLVGLLVMSLFAAVQTAPGA